VTAPLTRRRAPAPPIGVVASITAGFETVNAQLGLVALPVALDLFLWLGPQLSVRPLVDESLRLLDEMTLGAGGLTPDATLLRQGLAQAALLFNLFSRLSTQPLGLPSLLALRGSALTPLGQPPVWPISNAGLYLVLFGLFSLVGLLFATLYFGGIAQQVRDGRLDFGELGRQAGGNWLRLILFALLAASAVFVIGGPTVVLASLAGLASPVLEILISVLGTSLILWLLLFAVYAVHGILLQQRGLFGSLWDSLRLVQASLPQTAGLVGAVTLIYYVLGLVWNLASSDSWLMVFGIAGHALVSTALIAATFVFYKDRYRWWVETQQALKEQVRN